jgi:RimJ/RimL family protein N-acetyltransferase
MLDLAQIPVLETSHLLLRRPDEADADGLAALFADPRYMRFLSDGKTADHAAAWESIAGSLGHWALRGFGCFAVEQKGGARFIGWCGLLFPEGWPGIEIAWGISPRLWGRGFATEAARAVRDDAFGGLGLTRLVSLIHPDNAASIRVASKLGARFERTIKLRGNRMQVYALAAP